MTLDTPCVAASMTLGDRHLKAARSQLDGALDRGPSLVEKEGKEEQGIVVKEGRGVKRCARTAQPCHTITTGCGYITLLKVFFSSS